MKKWIPFGVLVVAVLVILVGAVTYPGKTPRRQAAIPVFGTDVPVIQIALGGMEVEEFRNSWKTVEVSDSSLVTAGNGGVRKYDGVEISGRGNSSWMNDKKPFQAKLAKRRSFLGLEKAKKWIFIANAYDPSFMRNDVAYILAEMLDGRMERRGKFAEVTIGDSYEGLYYVVHKVEIDKNAVDLRDVYGVLVELDNIHNEAEVCYNSYANNCIVLQDAVSKDSPELASEAMEVFMRDFDKLERAVQKGDYAEAEELADMRSFAEYYLVNEFTVNPDAYSSSFYMHKDGEKDKIHAGPVWDFDLGFGSEAWSWTEKELEVMTQRTMIREDDVFGRNGHSADTKTARLIYYLMRIPEFRAEVKQVFMEKMYGREMELEDKIWETSGMIEKAALRDEARWKNEDTREFTEEVERLVEFVRERYEYFEGEYGE